MKWKPKEETKEELYEKVEEVFQETKAELPGEHTLDPVENVVQTEGESKNITYHFEEYFI